METKKIFRLGILALVVSIMFACTSMKTIIIGPVLENGSYLAPKNVSLDGLTYYMPKKDFVVTVSVSDSGKTVTSSTTSAYPDLSKQYVIKYKNNIFGDNKLVAGINEKGLLSSINSKTESKVNEIFKNFAKSAGYITALGFMETDTKIVCSKTGDYIFMSREPVKNWEICDGEFTVNIIKYETDKRIVKHTKAVNTEHSGIFYRQNIPYTINVVSSKKGDKGIVSNTIVFSPSESKTHYLPIAKSFFANNEAKLKLSDGIITEYTQDNKSELVALTSIPADIIEAYFGAITSAFTKTSGADTAESTALTNSLNLELAKIKYNLCMAAIKDNNDELIKQLECSN